MKYLLRILEILGLLAAAFFLGYLAFLIYYIV